MSFIDPKKRKIRFSGIDKGSISKLDECGLLAEEEDADIPVPPADPCESFSLTETHSDNDVWEGANGSINIVINGGTPDFTYVWSNGKTTKDVSSLAPGSYSLTVTDSNGCVSQISVVIADISEEPSPAPPNTSDPADPGNQDRDEFTKRVHFCGAYMSGAKMTGVGQDQMAMNLCRPGEQVRPWYTGGEETWWQAKDERYNTPYSSYDYVGSFPVNTAKKYNDFVGEGEYNYIRSLPNSIASHIRSIYVPLGTRLVVSTDRSFSDETKRYIDVVGPTLLYGFFKGKRNTKTSYSTGKHLRSANLAFYARFGEYTDSMGVGYDNNAWAVNLYNLRAMAIFVGLFFKVTYDQSPRTPFFKDVGVPGDAPADFSHVDKFAFTYADMMTVLGGYPLSDGSTRTGPEFYNFWSNDENMGKAQTIFINIGWLGMRWRYSV